jgi:transaldolase/glucose-6-phosphate isomerase
MKNPMREARTLGTSFWYDTLSRALLTSGELRGMVERDGLAGVTSNPTIFEKAMTRGLDYERSLRELAAVGSHDAKTLYEELALEDVRAAADLLRPVYDQFERADGFVSLEVSPHLAHDTDGSADEARRLFRAAGRENVMIKLPGTREAMPAIEHLTSEGINVNVTLLFGLDAYRACADAYIDGLEQLCANGDDPRRVAGVASFFLSRIDTAVDDRIAAKLKAGAGGEASARLARLRGKVAIANAKLAYQHYQELVASPRWLALAERGAHPQRLLWASTGTKNPAYPPTMYVDALIGPDTVATVPADTYRAYLAQGRPRPTLTERIDEARATLEMLADLGIGLDGVTHDLLEEGIASFSASFDRLLASLARRQVELRSELIGAQMSAR